MGLQGELYISDTGNNRVRRVGPDGLIQTTLGDGSPASSGTGGPARNLPVDAPRELAVDPYSNLFVTSRNTVRLVAAGDNCIADGSDQVSTVYGAAPRDEFPTSLTRCLSGIAVHPADDSRVYVSDACLGFLIELRRE